MLLKLFDEKTLMQDLLEESLNLVHSTRTVRAIKLILNIHDILELNLVILDRFKDQQKEGELFPWWDVASLKELNITRCELVLFYRPQFMPLETLDNYNCKITKFINIADQSVGGKIAC